MSEKVEIPPRGKFANRYELRTLEVGEYHEILEELYSIKFARKVGTALRYYENDQPGKKFVQRKRPHPTKEGKFIVTVYRSK